MTVLKVSKMSNPHAVAGAIAGLVRDNGQAVMQAIGAGATNQAVKAIAIARSFMREEGADLICAPCFMDVDFNGETRTALRFEIGTRSQPGPRPDGASPDRDGRANRGGSANLEAAETSD
jgi:stage V sporulation protein S